MGNLLNQSCFPEEPKLHKSYIHTSLFSSHLKSQQTVTKYENISSNHQKAKEKFTFLFFIKSQKIDNGDDISIKYISRIFHLFYYMEKKIKEDHHQEQQREELNSTKNTETTTSTHMMNLVTSSDHHHHQMELAGNNMNLSTIFDTPISSPFPYSYFSDHSSNNPNSFLYLLRQDQPQFASSSNSSSFSFDAFHLQNNTNHFFTDLPTSQPITKAESSEVVSTTPTSPNSTSFSSSFNEAANENINKEVTVKDQEDGDQHEPKGTKPQ